MESKRESKSFPLDDFSITLSLDHTQLTIKAEHSSTFSTYSLSVNNDTARHLTNGICEDVGTLYQLLMECLKKESTESTLSTNNEALLTYQGNLKASNLSMKVAFTIQLEKEAELSEQKKYQLLVKKMGNIETNCDARFQELEVSFLHKYIFKREQEKIEKKLDEIIPRIESLVEEMKIIKMNITQLDQRISILPGNCPKNEERKSEVEQEIQNMESNEFHSIIQY